MNSPKSAAVLFLSLVVTLAVPASARADTLALVGATVIDVADFGSSENDIEDATVVIEDGRIAALGQRSQVEIPTGAKILDVQGHYIVPGLTDGFAALNNQAYAQAYLECGVTSIIAVSGGRRGPLMEHPSPGPRLRKLESVGDEAASLEKHLTDLETLARSGVDIALLMYELRPEQLRALVERARELNLGTIGELGHTSYAEGVATGLDAVVHTTRYSLDLAPQTMARAVADQPFSNDLESPKWRYYRWLSEISPHDPRLRSFAEVLATSGIALMPTFSLLHLDRPRAGNPWNDPVSHLLNPADIDAPADRATGRHDYGASHQIAYSAIARAQFVLEEAYHRAGSRYLAGSATDVWGTMPGLSLHSELESLVHLGLTPRQALAAATSNFPATFANWGRRGLVREGWDADLLILTADPRANIGNLRSVSRVILGGTLAPTGLGRTGRDGVILERRTLEPPPGAPSGIKAEEITYLSDGLRVKGYLVRPKNGDGLPGLVYARGGNRDFGAITQRRVWGLLARMASWGYVVAGTQYRGVAGGEGREEFGGQDVNDLLNLIPVLEAQPEVDSTRLGLYGGSRGGLMTYLALTRTDRFKAAATRSGVTDLIAWRQERPEMDEVFSDIIPDWDTARDSVLLARSPARWVERMSPSTPILLLHGTADWRVSPAQAQSMAAALYRQSRPFRLVLLEGSDHSLGEHREEHDRQVREWFDRFVRDLEPLPDLRPHGD